MGLRSNLDSTRALLDAAGFPGQRTLDSVEYQTLKKFHEAIAGFAAAVTVATTDFGG